MLGGCAFGLAGSPPATYDLQAPPVERVHGGGSVQLTIYPPVAVKTIDTEEILVKGANGRVAYFSGAAWGDRLPRLFQARLVEALANSGAFRAILTNQDRVSGDLSLAIEIRDFEVEIFCWRGRGHGRCLRQAYRREKQFRCHDEALPCPRSSSKRRSRGRYPSPEWRLPASSACDRVLGVAPHGVECLPHPCTNHAALC